MNAGSTSGFDDRDFVYFRLNGDDFLLVPAGLLSPKGTTFLDKPGSRYRSFKNNFAALMPAQSRIA